MRRHFADMDGRKNDQSDANTVLPDVRKNSQDVNVELKDINTGACDVNDYCSWIFEADEDSYKKGELPLVEFIDDCGKIIRLRDAKGILISPHSTPDVLRIVNSFPARVDDVFVVIYLKSGTTWTWEITSMLRTGSRELVKGPPQHMENMALDTLEALPSPRVLSTHIPFSRLPKDILLKGCKIVWVVRNPWDVAVSYYHYIRKVQPFGYTGEWGGFFKLFMDGKVPQNSWFAHTMDWLKGMETTSNIVMVRYEDLRNNFKKEVRRIADHLHIPVTDERLGVLQEETSFANMSQRMMDVTRLVSRDGSSPMYRKGQCGDWHNWFLEQQSAELREAYKAAIGSFDRQLQYIDH